jgi:copper chaperone
MIDAMHCQSCVRRVSAAIMSVAPDARIDIDLPARRVTLAEGVDVAAVAGALAAAGYPSVKG